MEDIDVDYTDRLRTVFELCDEQNEGYITVDHFKNQVKELGDFGGEEIVGIVQLLDPEGKGKINFEEFCQGVQQISELHAGFLGPSSPICVHSGQWNFKSPKSALSSTPVHSESSQPLSTIKLIESESIETLVPSSLNHSPSATEISENSNATYNEYDTATDEDASALGLSPTESNLHENKSALSELEFLNLPTHLSEDDRDSAISGRSSEVNSRQDITDEENYEDYGEAGEVDSELDIRSHISDSDLPLTHHSNRKITTAAYANQLHRSSPARRGSFGSDEIYDNIDGSFSEVNDKIEFLQKQISLLTDNYQDSESKHSRQREENTLLVRKIHGLEEQLREIEIKSDEKVMDEQRRQRDFVNRHDRERADQLDYLTQRLQRVEKENDQAQADVTRLKSEVDKLKQEKFEIQERLSEAQYENITVREEEELLREKLKTQNENIEVERQGAAQLMDEMGKELELLRKYKIENELHRNRAESVGDLPARYKDLQAEIRQLQEENRSLRTSNEDLGLQLLSNCMKEGRSLLETQEGISLAEEIEHMDKDQLMSKLKEQQDNNRRLTQYVDRILLTILEKNPSLLEIQQS
uniref:Rab11 family-interacting protein 3 n=1 Tax=Leptochiton asellus TaxID=211853 RepID=A0A288XNJ7_9MOLL|nr:Rab11 family-interacting protein 3 [Leptochiton asellus]